MKLSQEQFNALVEYINAKVASAPHPNDNYHTDQVLKAYEELEEQLKESEWSKRL